MARTIQRTIVLSFIIIQLWINISFGCLDGLSDVDCSTESPVQMLRKVTSMWTDLPLTSHLIHVNSAIICTSAAGTGNFFGSLYFSGVFYYLFNFCAVSLTFH